MTFINKVDPPVPAHVCDRPLIHTVWSEGDGKFLPVEFGYGSIWKCECENVWVLEYDYFSSFPVWHLKRDPKPRKRWFR